MRNIYEILKEKNNGKKFPTTLLCYKSRNDEIDEGIITYLEGVGFDCRQVLYTTVNNFYKKYIRLKRKKCMKNI